MKFFQKSIWPSLFKAPVGLAILTCFIYWVYLLFTSQMVIVYDGLEYERLGKMLYQSGWVEYFKTGPHNEPLFPLLINFSMHVADGFSVPYQKVQAGLHILILFSAQLLTLFILRRLHILPIVQAFTILYMGISPTLVNATFSLWSEIATYPFVLGIIIFGVQCWESILSNNYKKIVLYGACLTGVFVMIISVKALFEYVFIVFMAPYFFLMIKSIIRRERKILVGTLMFLLITVVSFKTPLFLYKSLNQKYNGHFMLTDRGPYILYGNVAKRSEPLSFKRFSSGLAFVAGDGVCYKLFDKSDCDFWHIFTVEKYGRPKLHELERRGVPNDEIDSMLVNLAKEKILERPFQQTLLMFIESFKMLFWESTLVGFVSYPPWLQGVFEFTPFKNTLRLFVFLITSFSTVYVLRYTIKRRDQLFRYESPQNIETHILFFSLILIMSYTGLYALFMITTRAALPIASLFLVMIAFTAQKIMSRKKLDGNALL